MGEILRSTKVLIWVPCPDVLPETLTVAHVSQRYYDGLMAVIMSCVGNAMRVYMALGRNHHHGSHEVGGFVSLR